VQRLLESLVLDEQVMGSLIGEGGRGIIRVGMRDPILDRDVNDFIVASVAVVHRIAPVAQGPLRANRPASQPRFFGCADAAFGGAGGSS
jgi:hypothetical protein